MLQIAQSTYPIHGLYVFCSRHIWCSYYRSYLRVGYLAGPQLPPTFANFTTALNGLSLLAAAAAQANPTTHVQDGLGRDLPSTSKPLRMAAIPDKLVKRIFGP